MSDTKINLIRGEGRQLAGIIRLEEVLRRLSWIILTAVLAVSLVIGFLYLYTSRSMKAAEQRNVRLNQTLNAQSIKEGLILSLVERTRIASKALAAAKPWGKIFSLLTQAAPESTYRTVGIDDTALVTSTLELGSIDEAVTVVVNMISLATNRLLRSPHIQSFSMQEDGSIQMTVSFHPML